MRIALALLPFFAACDTQPAIDAQTYDPDQVVEAQSGDDDASMEAAPIPSASGWRNSSGRVLVGFTAAVGGRWIWPGQEPGMASGDAACQAMGADHVCSFEDLQAAEQAGDLVRAPTDITMWLFEEGLPTREGTCSFFGYQGAHEKWGSYARTSAGSNGSTRIDYDFAPATRWDDACLSDPEKCPASVPSGYPCNAKRAIACCK